MKNFRYDTTSVQVQTSIAHELSKKLNRRFYSINRGFAQSVTNALNDAGYVLHIQLGHPTFVRDDSASLVAIRTDNIYTTTSLAIILAADRAIRHLGLLRPIGVFKHASF